MKAKKCSVEGCEYPAWSKGYCSSHQYLRTDKKPGKLKTGFAKKKYPDISMWFSDRILECDGYCQECGENIPKFMRLASIAHILPKSKFPSAAQDPNNWIELCIHCHANFDNKGREHRKSMNVWPEVLRKFKLFRDHVTEPIIPEEFS